MELNLHEIRGGVSAAPFDAMLRPAATVSGLDCLLGSAAHQDTLYLRSNLGGPLLALLVGEAGQRVLSNHELVVRNSHHPDHGLGGGQENVGDDRCGGNPQALHLDTVVHTARTAGPSITDPGDQHVHLIHKFLDDFGFGGQ